MASSAAAPLTGWGRSVRPPPSGTGWAEAPSTFRSRELLGLLRSLKGSEIVSADVVEVAPVYDHAQITGIVAAQITYELISLMALDVRTNVE